MITWKSLRSCPAMEVEALADGVLGATRTRGRWVNINGQYCAKIAGHCHLYRCQIPVGRIGIVSRFHVSRQPL